MCNMYMEMFFFQFVIAFWYGYEEPVARLIATKASTYVKIVHSDATINALNDAKSIHRIYTPFHVNKQILIRMYTFYLSSFYLPRCLRYILIYTVV
jgi:hypothetical protein